MTVYYGVRHHSPACAYFVGEFLSRAKPDVLLIEGPADLSSLIPQLCAPEVELPAAILAYTESTPVHTLLYPMAVYSPEHAAMRWAVRSGVEVRFCDLPSYCVLSTISDDSEAVQLTSTNGWNPPQEWTTAHFGNTASNSARASTT